MLVPLSAIVSMGRVVVTRLHIGWLAAMRVACLAGV